MAGNSRYPPVVGRKADYSRPLALELWDGEFQSNRHGTKAERSVPSVVSMWLVGLSRWMVGYWISVSLCREVAIRAADT